jgi:hypothetical protein
MGIIDFEVQIPFHGWWLKCFPRAESRSGQNRW